ncbi:ATP-dependent RNA helicase HrpA [Orrella daihaiensis]|uniref:ATP-dependent RNA helicase HrpA n=1 Tax=Orrella daihaiensis TaxID=2782176 RepID=A0ABY4ATV4_9BURK|nr:ATP-dependent RNA helicase HrpA [Orrella daihaiensis]UOD51484.1 ATP-dependent RNA helicase HrpA [Orrella daihaiensis]
MNSEPSADLTVAKSPRAEPVISFDPALPVTQARDEIARAIASHQVVIISGQTGSGKTTQIPKICLSIGRGRAGMIGHTQPRRLAATSVAKRIAQELQTSIGELVGYQIRFHQRAASTTAIKLMTDGVLLAQTQRDRLLKQYDTLIIDEAHERSLNIDFLLGYLRQLLPKRPDLKVVITSATIDADRFAAHFAGPDGQPAPVIDVSGRLYPVQVLYHPVTQPRTQIEQGELTGGDDSDEERELTDAIVEAVGECARLGPGDVLVFLPGEREIREAAEALRKHHPPSTQILPLYARLSQNEQEEIFRPSTSARRVVLATNVAETSLTVPGIRFVVDSGLARVKRYSWRQKVEQLQVEPISQAAANQRAGRCGRLGPGVCIRLYDELDFKRRREFTEPEILRSSLAGVILRMKSLALDDIDAFPFVDPPTGRAIADGYQTLQELGALTQKVGRDGQALNHLTAVGRTLAKLPLDPRVGRMLLAARDQQCLHEMLIIASALAVQDPRERPMQARELADQAHAKFSDKQSEFLVLLKLWSWYHDQVAHKSSQRQLVKLLKQNYLSVPRLREWHDIHGQLAALVGEQGWRVNQTEATFEQIHSALLAGLLGQVGLSAEQAGHYQGVRGIRFWIHPSSKLAKRAGKWIMAAELVETSKLYARCIAKIEPVWIERVGGHLLQRSWSDPRWDGRRGQVVAHERATLFGLPVYSGRLVNYGPIDVVQARQTFIREALVPGELDVPFDFVAHNRRLIRQIEQLEHRSRRPDILVDEELIARFYDQLLPADICQLAKFRHWFRHLPAEQQVRWKLSREDLMQHEAAGITSDVFPKAVSWQGTQLKLDYHFEPGSSKDGVTLTVPLVVLNQLSPERWEWLVPGMLKEKVQWLVKSLPQKLRKHCVPLPEYAKAFFDRWFDRLDHPPGSLLAAIIQDIDTQFHVKVAISDFRLDSLPAHLFMNFKVIDEHGRMLKAGRNLAQIKADLGRQTQQTLQAMAAEGQPVMADVPQQEITGWCFDELPEIMEIRRQRQTVIGYPALVDEGSHCRIDVFDEPHIAREHHRRGVIRLLRLALKEQIRFIEKNLPQSLKLGVLYMPLGTWDELRGQIVDAALYQACLAGDWPVTAAQFDACREQAKERVGLLAQEMGRLVLEILQVWSDVQKRLVQFKVHPSACQDIHTQLEQLIHKYFVVQTPYEHLRHFPRYLQAVLVRFDALRADADKDQAKINEMAPLVANYQRAKASLAGAPDPALDEFRWMLEELRVALFAQRLRTPYPVSVKRLHKVWQALAR